MAMGRLWRLARSMQEQRLVGLPCLSRYAERGSECSTEQNRSGLDFRRFYATKKGAITPKSKTKKGPQQGKGKKGAGKGSSASEGGGGASTGTIEDFTIREPTELVEDNLFTGDRGISDITAHDINKYFFLSEEDVAKYYPEGFPRGMLHEFQMSRSRYVRVRRFALEMVNKLNHSATGEFAFLDDKLLPPNLPREVRQKIKEKLDAQKLAEAEESLENSEESQPADSPESTQNLANNIPESNSPSKSHKSRYRRRSKEREGKAVLNYKHHILDGPAGCGKSFALAVIVQWARAQGWLVFYVPRAKEWTRGGYYYLNEFTGFWDTPLQAQAALKGFLESHGDMLGQIKCRVSEPLFLGEAAGLGRIPGPQEYSLPGGSTLKDLVEKGISEQAAASNIVVRLRQELDLVTEYPVLIAVDEYNSWFTFSEFNQFLDFRKTRTIHAKELGMVNAFRKMDSSPQHFIGAFSQSTVVGKLPLELPGAPRKYRIDVSRLDKPETDASMQYYHRQNLLHNVPQEDAINRLFFLTNGNGTELRKLVRYI